MSHRQQVARSARSLWWKKASRWMLALISLSAFAPLGGCAGDEGNAGLEARLESRNSSYENFLERRSMRREARDERYRRWWDSW